MPFREYDNLLQWDFIEKNPYVGSLITLRLNIIVSGFHIKKDRKKVVIIETCYKHCLVLSYLLDMSQG